MILWLNSILLTPFPDEGVIRSRADLRAVTIIGYPNARLMER